MKFRKQSPCLGEQKAQNLMLTWCCRFAPGNMRGSKKWLLKEPLVMNIVKYSTRRERRKNLKLTKIESTLIVTWDIIGLTWEEINNCKIRTRIRSYIGQLLDNRRSGIIYYDSKKHVHNIISITIISTRVVRFSQKLIQNYEQLKVKPVYAPTSAQTEDQVDNIHNDNTSILNNTPPADFSILCKNVNAKIGLKAKIRTSWKLYWATYFITYKKQIFKNIMYLD